MIKPLFCCGKADGDLVLRAELDPLLHCLSASWKLRSMMHTIIMNKLCQKKNKTREFMKSTLIS